MEILHFDAQHNFQKRDTPQSDKEIKKLLRPLRGKKVLVSYTILINGLLYENTIEGRLRIYTHQNAIHLMWGSRSSGKKYHMKMGFYRITDVAIFKKRKG